LRGVPDRPPSQASQLPQTLWLLKIYCGSEFIREEVSTFTTSSLPGPMPSRLKPVPLEICEATTTPRPPSSRLTTESQTEPNTSFWCRRTQAPVASCFYALLQRCGKDRAGVQQDARSGCLADGLK
jgi:hypothetical protein